MGMNKVLYCDLDGTLISYNLEGGLVKHLIKTKRLTIVQYLSAAFTLPFNSLRRRAGLPHLFKSWTAFRSADDKTDVITAFVREKAKDIPFNPAVLEFVKSFKGKKILLTGCDTELATAFLNETGSGGLFDEVIGARMKRGGFLVSTHPFGKGKPPFVDSGCISVGVANEYADRFFLKKCTEAFVAAPDAKLGEVARTLGWKEL